MPKVRVKRHAVTQPSDTSYRLIPLTQCKNAIVDCADFKFLSQWNWTASRHRNRFYAVRCENGVRFYMHRVLLAIESKETDHKNGNSLDNRRENLRSCTRSRNACNMPLSSVSTTGYRGVTRSGSRWQAQCTEGGKYFFLGRFADKQDAARAYDSFVKLRRGEFARTNF